MKIQRFGTDGLALVHSADGREMISMTREQAREVHKQLSEHFAHEPDVGGSAAFWHKRYNELHDWQNAEVKRLEAALRRDGEKLMQLNAVIDGLRAELAALKAQKAGSATIQFSSAMSPYSWNVTDNSGYIGNEPRKPSAELIPYIPQEKQPPALDWSAVAECFKAQVEGNRNLAQAIATHRAKQPPASILKDNKAAQNWAPGESYSNKYMATKSAESHANAATLPTSIMKGDKEISDLRGQIRSHASHANALRGNLERDTQEAGVKPADAGLGNAWKDGWKV